MTYALTALLFIAVALAAAATAAALAQVERSLRGLNIPLSGDF